MNFVIFLLNFDEILSEFHEKFQEIVKILNILRNNARKIRKMLEISGICEKFYFVEWKFQWTPYSTAVLVLQRSRGAMHGGCAAAAENTAAPPGREVEAGPTIPLTATLPQEDEG